MAAVSLTLAMGLVAGCGLVPGIGSHTTTPSADMVIAPDFSVGTYNKGSAVTTSVGAVFRYKEGTPSLLEGYATLPDGSTEPIRFEPDSKRYHASDTAFIAWDEIERTPQKGEYVFSLTDSNGNVIKGSAGLEDPTQRLSQSDVDLDSMSCSDGQDQILVWLWMVPMLHYTSQLFGPISVQHFEILLDGEYTERASVEGSGSGWGGKYVNITNDCPATITIRAFEAPMVDIPENMQPFNAKDLPPFYMSEVTIPTGY